MGLFNVLLTGLPKCTGKERIRGDLHFRVQGTEHSRAETRGDLQGHGGPLQFALDPGGVLGGAGSGVRGALPAHHVDAGSLEAVAPPIQGE